MTPAKPVPAKPRRGATLPAVETLAAGLAHEVRNPLNALRINLSILEHELSELVPDRGAHVFEVAGRIARELRHLDDFVSEFLRYARPSRPRLDPVAVGPLLSDLATFLAAECSRKGVTLSLALSRGPRSVAADAPQLKHALLNLLLNALQATPAGGSVRIRTAGSRERLEIAIHDSGEGIASDVLPRVFDAFFSTREGGTGLGLPIARRIAAAHRGTLVLRSRPGRGTTAILCLPVRPAARPSSARRTRAAV
jgi:signal transduction histidine kinase